MENYKFKYHSEVPNSFASYCEPKYDIKLIKYFDLDENSALYEYEDETLLFVQSSENNTCISSNKAFSINKQSTSQNAYITLEN